ncbi:MAG: cation:proton antiporter domain-containing protein, partial [Planctomycetota bacterium]
MIHGLIASGAGAAGGTDVHALILFLSLLLMISIAVSLRAKKIRVPYTVLLVVVGVGLRYTVANTGLHGTLGHMNLSADLILFVMLPVLLFESAFDLDSRRLFKNIVPILTLAIPALLISTMLVGGIMYLGTRGLGVSFAVTLLFGAMISATDPVAVIAIFKELGAPKRLTILVEGESLFNDGTGFVVFATILATIESGHGFTAGVAGGAVLDFGRVFFGGILVGFGFGMLASRILSYLDEHLIETMVTTVLALLTFLVAEHYLHVSGVMAVVAAGLTLGNYGRTKITQSALPKIEGYWHYLAFVMNSLVFLLVGFSVELVALGEYWGYALLAFGTCVVVRALLVFGITPIVNRVSGAQTIDRGYQTILWWGGLRGAMALAMALFCQPAFAKPAVQAAHGAHAGQFILMVTIGVVLATIIIPGMTMNKLLDFLGFNRLTPAELVEREAGALLAHRKARETIALLHKRGTISKAASDAVEGRYQRLEDRAAEALDALRRGGGADDALEDVTLFRHCLMVERRLYLKLFKAGDVPEDVMRDMRYGIDCALDRLTAGFPPFGGRIKIGGSRLAQIGVRLAASLARAPLVGPLVENYRTARLARAYEQGEAVLRALEGVLAELKNLDLAHAVDPKSLARANEFFRHRQMRAQAELREIAEVFPELAEHTERAIATRAAIETEMHVLGELIETGRLTQKAGSAMRNHLEAAFRRSTERVTTAHLLKPDEVLAKIPFFTHLDKTELTEIVGVLRPLSLLRGEYVVHEGEAGHSMFLIARGKLNVVKRRTGAPGEEMHLATLKEGGFFGEIALLTQCPRTASVRAATPCGLLELRRHDLTQLTEAHPEIGVALTEAYKDRVLAIAIAEVPVFKGLDSSHVAAIASIAVPIRYAAGQVITEAGDLTPSLYFLTTGSVSVETPGKPPEDAEVIS